MSAIWRFQKSLPNNYTTHEDSSGSSWSTSKSADNEGTSPSAPVVVSGDESSSPSVAAADSPSSGKSSRSSHTTKAVNACEWRKSQISIPIMFKCDPLSSTLIFRIGRVIDFFEFHEFVFSTSKREFSTRLFSSK